MLCDEFLKYNHIDKAAYEKYEVKKGLRNADSTGVLAGLTKICNVHGYIINERERIPAEGKLTYRGIDINDIVENCIRENRFGFEETVWLLLFGSLPTAEQLAKFQDILEYYREFPKGFLEDIILKAPSNNVMNKLGRSVLALYSYDHNPEDTSLTNVMFQAIQIIARMPIIMVEAYQVKKRYYYNESMYFHPVVKGYSVAQNILAGLRADQKFTEEEAKLLDMCLILHAEHGGGNNSTFTARVLTSTGTDTYAAISAAIGSLKGPRHGGANLKVMEMLEAFKSGVSDWSDDAQIKEFLRKIIRKEAGDRSGLIYGMGHAVYTISDPRAVILKRNAKALAAEKGMEEEFGLLESIERLAPEVFYEEKGLEKVICANVDMYSGFVYRMLGIPQDLFTPMFAISRVAGWCAHRIEEINNSKKIIRPAYKSLSTPAPYIPIGERG